MRTRGLAGTPTAASKIQHLFSGPFQYVFRYYGWMVGWRLGQPNRAADPIKLSITDQRRVAPLHTLRPCRGCLMRLTCPAVRCTKSRPRGTQHGMTPNVQ